MNEKGKITKLLEYLFSKGCCDGRQQADDDEPSLSKVLPAILKDLNNEPSITSLRCLNQLCNEKNGVNRIAMLCCCKWDVLTPLIYVMTKCDGKERRLACLILANLSIPFENKAVMALGNLSLPLFSALYSVIQERSPEAYIACICLANISYLDDALEPIFQFSQTETVLSPLENSNSACRILERVIQTCPYPPSKATVQSEAVRWTCVILKYCSKSEINCSMIAKTTIPAYIVGYLNYTKNPLVKWTNGSVEDSSLQIILHMCQWSETKELLKRLNTVRVLQPIIGKGGIHDYRAVTVTCNLEI